jgi:hypothetical protein
METTQLSIPDVPIPAGVDGTDDWQADSPQPYRVLFGELRAIEGIHGDRVSVQATAVQFPDGRVDDGGVHEPPHVYLGDDALSSVQARALAALLVQVADEADRWAAA